MSDSPERAGLPTSDRLFDLAAKVGEKVVFATGCLAGTYEGTLALADVVTHENPMQHAEGFGLSVVISSIGIVTLRTIDYYFRQRPNSLKP